MAVLMELQQPLVPNEHGQRDEQASSTFIRRVVDDNFDHQFVGCERPWVGVKNLDTFFRKVYDYFYAKGFWRMLISNFANLIMLGFTVCFSTFLLLCVDWNGILQCNNATETCEHIISIRDDVLTEVSFSKVLVLIYFFVFSLYWMWNLFSFAFTFRDCLEMYYFFNNKLNISEDDLQTMKWCEVTTRIEEVQKSFKISIIRDHNALDIANRIMRKDNFLIAMINRNVFTLNLPILKELGCSPLLGKSLEWNLRICVLNSMFDEEFQIRAQFINHPEKLKTQFQRMAIVNLLLMPFILIFMVIFFFLKNAEQLHSNRNVMGPRQWTPLAEWRFREFNELQHVFQTRLALSHKPALLYIAQFPSSITSIVAKLLAYITGAIVAVLLVITLFLSTVVLEIQIMGHSLLWHLAFFSGLLAASRSLISSPAAGYRVIIINGISQWGNFEHLLDNVFSYTHFVPSSWRSRAHSPSVRREFSSLYRAKLSVFLAELWTVFLSPAILSTTLADSSDSIVSFVRDHTTRIAGVGDVCTYSTYKFERNGDNRGVRTTDSIDVNNMTCIPISSCTDAKMEKSFVSFALSHPQWTPDQEGAQLLRSLADQSISVEHNDDESDDMSESNAILAMNVSQLLQHKVLSSFTSEESGSELHDTMMRSMQTLYEKSVAEDRQ